MSFLNRLKKHKVIGIAAGCVVATLLASCAVDKSQPLKRDPGPQKMAEELGCTEQEVALCVEVDCRPEDYSCVNREDARRILGVPEYRPR